MMGTTVRHESLFPIGLDIRPGGCPFSTEVCIIHVLLQDVTMWIIIDITWLPTLVYVHD